MEFFNLIIRFINFINSIFIYIYSLKKKERKENEEYFYLYLYKELLEKKVDPYLFT